MGKNSVQAPTPDPLIGQAAQSNSALGQEQLDFAKQQYADSQGRQNSYDDLTSKVANSALASQDLSNQWAQDDRNVQTAERTKYDAQSDQDRAAGLAAQQGLSATDADNKALAQEYEQTFGKAAQAQSALGQAQVGRYQQNFAPVEDKVASDAMNWDSANRQDMVAGQAKADALSAGQQAQDAQARQMMSMGVNPNSGKFAATSRANNTAVALSAAGAENAARDNARMQGVTMRQQAAQLGQQVLGSGQQANSLSVQDAGAAQAARQQGLSNTMSLTNQGLAARGIGNTSASLGLSQQGAGYTGLGTGLSAGGAATSAGAAGNNYAMQNGSNFMNGMSTAGTTTASGAGIASSLYGNQINAYNSANQANGAMMNGIGSMVGTGAALYL